VLNTLAHAMSTGADVSVGAARHELTVVKAAVLGIVEGITEYLPISSTGHLLVTERLLDVGQTSATKDAADTYTITIQAGAILAVLVLYKTRLMSMLRGVFGRDPAGRQVSIATIVAFIPAAIVGVGLEKVIKDHLFGVGPVIAAWIVGGVVILVFSRRFFVRGHATGAPIEQITVRMAIIIGAAQCIALWPGTSRSMVTILAALAVGLSVSAAVEFSFILGLLTLSAATAYDALKHGKEMLDTFGVVAPVVGFIFAFLAALLAVKWLVTYLQRHGLEIFGWYRLGIAALALILLATHAI
jgi:undecaprenyl-diphosphatase